MKSIWCLVLALLFISCQTQPEPLIAGTDACSSCKMPFSDIRFGGEIITDKGKIYKFDDLYCMINFLRKDIKLSEKTEKMLAVNYSDTKKFIPVNDGCFLVSDQLHSPMNSGIICLESRKEAEAVATHFPGKIVSWKELNHLDQ